MEEQSIYNNLEPKIHDKIGEALCDAAPVLDIACGDGRLCSLIASKVGSKTYGVDLSISHLAKAWEKAEAQGISGLVCLLSEMHKNSAFLTSLSALLL